MASNMVSKTDDSTSGRPHRKNAGNKLKSIMKEVKCSNLDDPELDTSVIDDKGDDNGNASDNSFQNTPEIPSVQTPQTTNNRDDEDDMSTADGADDINEHEDFNEHEDDKAVSVNDEISHLWTEFTEFKEYVISEMCKRHKIEDFQSFSQSLSNDLSLVDKSIKELKDVPRNNNDGANRISHDHNNNNLQLELAVLKKENELLKEQVKTSQELVNELITSNTEWKTIKVKHNDRQANTACLKTVNTIPETSNRYSLLAVNDKMNDDIMYSELQNASYDTPVQPYTNTYSGMRMAAPPGNDQVSKSRIPMVPGENKYSEIVNKSNMENTYQRREMHHMNYTRTGQSANSTSDHGKTNRYQNHDNRNLYQNQNEYNRQSTNRYNHNQHGNNKRQEQNTRMKKKVVVYGDSIVSNIRRKELTSCISDNNLIANVRSFGGSTSEDMLTYVKPTLEKEVSDTAIIHVGTNDVSNSTRPGNSITPHEIASSIIEVGRLCHQTYGVRRIIISGITRRNRNTKQQVIIDNVNNILKEKCSRYGFIYLDNGNMEHWHIANDGLHLSKDGTDFLTENFAYVLNEHDF